MERPNQSMPNGVNTMQRPQSGNQMQQIHAIIMNDLKQRIGSLPPGWQSTFDIGQRASRIMQLVTTLRLLQQDANKCLQIAQGFEERCMQESPTKDVYNQKIQSKLVEIQAKRAQQASQLPLAQQMGGMPMNNAGGFGLPQNDMNGFNNMMQNPGMPAVGGMGGMNGMNGMNLNPNFNMNMNNFMGGGQAMLNGGLPNQTAQQGQGFPAQLQRPMQASPLPLQQQQQQQNNTLDPSALQNTQPPQNMNQGNQQQQVSMGGNAQSANNGSAEVFALARKMYAQTPDDKKVDMRQSYLASLDPQTKAAVLNQGGDPLVRFFINQARENMIKHRKTQMAQFNAQGGSAPSNNNGNMPGAANMQQGLSQSGMPHFDLSTMLGQQATAIRAGEDGEQVVPASNNQNGPLGAQTNMNQGLNPQMLANQNGQPGNIQLQQMLAFEREKQRQRQQQQNQNQGQNQQNQLASNQAMAQQQAQQLRGIPGGLNTPNPPNGAQLNGPAFNMLNRPLGAAAPGQSLTNTPQVSRSQNAPTTSGAGASQVIQHHQNMINQNSQQQAGQELALNQQVLNSLPAAVREKLSELQPAQINEMLARWKEQNAGGPNAQHVAGLLAPNTNANGLAGNNAHFMPGMPNGSAIPGFNSQPPLNQQTLQQGGSMDPIAQQRMHQFQQQQQLKLKAMDMRPFPKQVLSTLSISVPDTVTEWGKLKQHISQNQNVLPPNTLARLQQAQMAYFEAHTEEVSAAVMQVQQRMAQISAIRGQLLNGQPQPQMQQPPNAGPTPQMPNGQAPQAQMTQPNGVMQQSQMSQMANGGAQGNNQSQVYRVPQPPTPADVLEFRQQYPQTAHMSDDQCRRAIMERRMQMARQRAAQTQQQALQNQQQVNMRDQVQRAHVMANDGQQNNTPAQSNHVQQQQTGPRPQQPRPQQQANVQVLGQKRAPPGNDDLMEIPNPNLGNKGTAPPAPNMQTNQNRNQHGPQAQIPFSQMRMPTQQDLAKMTPEQRNQTMARLKQLESIRRAQSSAQQAVQAAPGPNQQQPQVQQVSQAPLAAGAAVQNPNNGPDRTRDLHAWWKETLMSNPKGPPAQLDAASKQQLMHYFKRWWAPLTNIDKTYSAALRVLGESDVREAMRIRILYNQNVADSEGNPKEYFSVGLQEWKPVNEFLMRYFTALQRVKGNAQAPPQPPQQMPRQPPQQQVQPMVAQQPPAQPITNLAEPPAKQNEQQRAQASTKPPQAPQLDRKPSQQGGVRKASASSKVPAAPTEKKSFDWQIGSGLTADKLKLPASKKRRTDQDSPEARGSVSAGSPIITQSAPAQIGKPAPMVPPKAPEPEKAKFKCDDLSCDASIAGFDSEEKLKAHKEAEHGDVGNAFDFLMEQSAHALGVDKDGKEKKAPAKAAIKVQPASGKVGTPTPGTKIGTPATPAAGSKPASKPAQTAAGKDGKAEAEQEKTLLEIMAEKIGFELPPTKDQSGVDTTINHSDDLFLSGLQGAFNDSDVFVNDWTDLTDVTDWGFPPLEPDSSPELTPSSRDSDVSQGEKLRINMSWDAFGNGDTGVPEILELQELGLNDGAEASASKGEDVAMADADGDVATNEAGKDKEKEGSKTTAADDEWNWQGDMVDWDWVAHDGAQDFDF